MVIHRLEAMKPATRGDNMVIHLLGALKLVSQAVIICRKQISVTRIWINNN